MTTFEAVQAIEMDESATFEQQIEAFQSLIDSGVVWQLQGWYGRAATNLIEAGYCTPRAEG